ncbi:peptidase [Enterococcus silesiacus]|uniref:LPXTG-domain-containing protein cell wall anchor domain n=1 Tax=Enterococcus silesiacus TaxID=332949 RepID=A0A0S3KFB6_9ENTE|nr:bacterial Ig-like domain-containing protein [Enterococcus silesiacus]ALS02745.1 peptidase [Enterococcus silesiacus]OJG85485.1 LPXTG-domain-containing protein cell wall anchor domain [Enterococcus silesiacus]
MKKRKLHIFMLAVLLTQSFSSTVSVFATTDTEENAQNGQAIDTQTQENLQTDLSSDEEKMSLENSKTSETDETVESEASITVQDDSQVEETEQSTKEAATTPKTKAAKANLTIEDELLTSMTITNMEGVEYSQSNVNRLLNTTPVTAKLNFVIKDQDYVPGSVYTMTLPDHLGYSDISGEVANVGANWSVDAQSKTLTITFNQRITETQFNLDLKSYVYTDAEPLVTIKTPGQTTNQYNFDLYEEVAPIKYEETTNKYGIQGNIYYNLDRSLSGSQTLEIVMSNSPGATFDNTSKEPIGVFSYDVDINGNVIAASKQALAKDQDYTIDEDNAYRGAVTITNMDQQKAYALSVDRALALESVSNYSYSFYNNYPTTKLGSVSLNRSTAQYGGLEFTAKTSKDQKSLKEVNLGSLQSANFQAKGNYYVYIYNIPTQTKVGEQIVLESKNGQKITEYQFSATDTEYQTVPFTDFFEVKQEENKLILTATKDSVLRLKAEKLIIPFDQKDIDITLSTPVVNGGKEIMLVSDQYLQPISIINPNNVETAWGNADANGAYSGDTTIAIEGSDKTPVKNAAIKIEHPNYLKLRMPTGEYSDYKLNRDYTITSVEGGTLIKFTTPVTRSFNLDLGFNYIPDSLAKSKSIPIDTLDVTLSADDYEAVHTTVRTGRKMYSERTLQGSKNQFLVNARNDSFDNLSITTKIPNGVDVVFDIYDVSNDQVESIYPQYWDRGQYFDKPLAPTSEAYPTITFDEATNSYKFDFGKTSKRYIVEYKYANGWIDTKTINVTGSAVEPLYGDQVMSAIVAVNNEGVEILSANQTAHESLKNVTKNEIKTKNINSGTRSVKNPTFDIKTKGNTNAGIDLNSIVIEGVPQDVYTIKQTATGAQIIFDEYTLTENITITYNTVSKNAGQISTETSISADNLEQMTETRRTVTTTPLVLRFSDGDAEGIVYLAQAQFRAYNEKDQAINIPNVLFELVDNVTHNQTEFTTDENGEYKFDAIMSGEYTLRATAIPVGYTIAEEYLEGKAIKVMKDTNSFEIPLKEVVDHTSVSAKDSTIYVGSHWQPEDNFTGATDQEGKPMAFDQITVAGTVDTEKVGEYEITYRNQDKEAKAIVFVVANQETLFVKDSTIYVGDSWQAKDNFVSATDEHGASIPFEEITPSGTVDTTKPGIYEMTYRFSGQTEIAKITVLPNQTSVLGKDSTISVGTTWTPADNFVEATDKTGKPVAFDQITVTGTVDTSKVGDYEVTYENQGQKDQIIVHVVAVKATLAVKDSTIYVGDPWKAADNFISATDETGQTISIQTITVTGTVDTTKAGVYEVVYGYGTLKETAKVTVKADQSTLVVKDSTIYVGDDWQSVDNFVSATDRDGKAISFEEVEVTGTVETKEKGENQVSYTIQTTQKADPSNTKKAVKAQKQRTETAKITVLERNSPKPNETNKKQTHLSKQNKQGHLPKAGEKDNHYVRLIGLLALSITMIGVIRSRKRRTD